MIILLWQMVELPLKWFDGAVRPKKIIKIILYILLRMNFCDGTNKLIHLMQEIDATKFADLADTFISI